MYRNGFKHKFRDYGKRCLMIKRSLNRFASYRIRCGLPILCDEIPHQVHTVLQYPVSQLKPGYTVLCPVFREQYLSVKFVYTVNKLCYHEINVP